MHMRELWQDNYWIIKSRSQPHRFRLNTNSSSKFKSRKCSKQVMETLGVLLQVLVSIRIHIWLRILEFQSSNLRCRKKLKRSSLKELAQSDQILHSVLLVPVEDKETILEVALDLQLKPRLLLWHLCKFQNLNKWIKEFHTTKHNKIINLGLR